MDKLEKCFNFIKECCEDDPDEMLKVAESISDGIRAEFDRTGKKVPPPPVIKYEKIDA